MNARESAMHRRFARHVARQENPNPFPGIGALERKSGYTVTTRLGSNECLDAPMKSLREAFGRQFCDLTRLYGDPECHALRQALAELNQVIPEQVVVDSGADALIYLGLRALCEVGDTVVCSAGTYPTLAYFAKAAGCQVAEVAYRAEPLEVDLEAMLEAVARHAAKVVYIANPDNPTGSWQAFDAIVAFAARLPEHCTLLLDEAYFEYCEALRPFGGQVLANVIRLRSLSKTYALAGLRVGYALATPEVHGQLSKVRIHYAVGGLAQHAALLALGDQAHARALLIENAFQRETLSAHLNYLDYQVLPSATNFVSLLLPTAEQAQNMVEYLLERHISVHRPRHAALGHLIRITLCDAAVDIAFLSHLQEIAL